MSEQPAKYQVGEQAEQAIEVERYEANQIIGQRWRVHSYHDGESIMLTDQGMRELLDELLKIADQFSDEMPASWRPREEKPYASST